MSDDDKELEEDLEPKGKILNFSDDDIEDDVTEDNLDDDADDDDDDTSDDDSSVM